VTNTNDNRIDVLIIEDNPADALLIKRTLHRESKGSIHVEQVDRLSDGIDRIAKGGIDAILLDLSLPDSYGRETFQQLHAQSPGAPIVVLTGLDDAEHGRWISLLVALPEDLSIPPATGDGNVLIG